MAGARKDSRLGSRTARVALKARHQPYWINIGEGVALGYRRGPQGGSWYVRAYSGKGQYQQAQIGGADDYLDANGETVLTFYQAQEKARKLAQSHDRERGIGLSLDLTVAEAADKYLAWYKDHRRAYTETEHSVRVHILPALGATRVDELTSAAIRRWLEQLAAKPARVRSKKQAKQASYRTAPKTADEKRARKSTANRIFNILKAMLNRAYQDGLVTSDSAWRKVKPFAKVDEARIRFLTDAEALMFVNACPADLRQLVRAALLTGARFGELAGLQAKDVNLDTAQVYFSPAKSGRSRHVPLNDEGVTLFKGIIAGKTGDQLLFTKASGEPWGKNHHVRPLLNACNIAKVKPAISFHELRHTYASHLAQAGVDLLTISKLLGHADTRITSKHYAHLADKTLAAAVAKLPSFGATEPAKVRSIR
jgi:integrase